MVEDGNGGSQLVALWLVANEERDTMLALMDLFVRHNDCAAVQCVMTDKDMLERDVLKEKLPQAAIKICLFHVRDWHTQTWRRPTRPHTLGLRIGKLSAYYEAQQVQHAQQYQQPSRKHEQTPQISDHKIQQNSSATSKLMFLRQSVEVRESPTTVPVLRLQESETVLATG